jgi:hypothetical protein
VITSKAANSYQFKTGQRKWPSRTEIVLPCRLLWWQVGFRAPAARASPTMPCCLTTKAICTALPAESTRSTTKGTIPTKTDLTLCLGVYLVVRNGRDALKVFGRLLPG